MDNIQNIRGGGGTSYPLLVKALFPMSTSMWWYPTTYAIFLLIHPFLHKGLTALKQDELGKLIIAMIAVWSVSTIIPFFSYGSSNMVCFIMLYAIVLYYQKYGVGWLTKRRLRWFVFLGYCAAAISIVLLDLVGTRIHAAAEYSCYYIRGNYRLLPMMISVSLFLLASEWKVQSKIINYMASLTFGIYLIHMHPLVFDFLFNGDQALLDITNYVHKSTLPLIALGFIAACFFGCAGIEALRKGIDGMIEMAVKNILGKEHKV